MSVNKARLAINGLSVLALVLSITVGNEILSMVLILTCILFAVVILYRNLSRLSNVSQYSPKMMTLQGVTIFTVVMVLYCVVGALLFQKGILPETERNGKIFIGVLFTMVMVGFGNIAPKIPFNRHTGLRLPWTVMDEATWIVAHRITGYISIPLVLIYLAGIPTVRNFAQFSVAILLIWIAIPAVLSLVFWYRKYYR